MDSIFRDCVHLRTHRIGNGRYNYLPEDCRFHLRLIQECLRDFSRTDGRARPLAWHHEDWREGGSSECVGKSTKPGLHPSLPGHSEEPSGDGKHLHEHRFEYAGTR